jgi:hypothetical protein
LDQNIKRINRCINPIKACLVQFQFIPSHFREEIILLPPILELPLIFINYLCIAVQILHLHKVNSKRTAKTKRKKERKRRVIQLPYLSSSVSIGLGWCTSGFSIVSVSIFSSICVFSSSSFFFSSSSFFFSSSSFFFSFTSFFFSSTTFFFSNC